jgi:hypothetical protein
MQTQEQLSPSQSTPKRTPYRAPKLVRYGPLASLTSGGIATLANEDGTVRPLSDA